MQNNKKRIAIFASGNGSNAAAICRYFATSNHIEIVAIVTNRETAGVLQVAQQYNIPGYYFSNSNWNNGLVKNFLSELNLDLIVLAGFLKLIPASIIANYPNKIVNIHPALLPNFGGEGMYGIHVHNAVLAAGESKTGITIHYINEEYDKGEIIAQFETSIVHCKLATDIEASVRKLEHIHYASTIEKLLL